MNDFDLDQFNKYSDNKKTSNSENREKRCVECVEKNPNDTENASGEQSFTIPVKLASDEPPQQATIALAENDSTTKTPSIINSTVISAPVNDVKPIKNGTTTSTTSTTTTTEPAIFPPKPIEKPLNDSSLVDIIIYNENTEQIEEITEENTEKTTVETTEKTTLETTEQTTKQTTEKTTEKTTVETTEQNTNLDFKEARKIYLKTLIFPVTNQSISNQRNSNLEPVRINVTSVSNDTLYYNNTDFSEISAQFSGSVTYPTNNPLPITDDIKDEIAVEEVDEISTNPTIGPIDVPSTVPTLDLQTNTTTKSDNTTKASEKDSTDSLKAITVNLPTTKFKKPENDKHSIENIQDQEDENLSTPVTENDLIETTTMETNSASGSMFKTNNYILFGENNLIMIPLIAVLTFLTKFLSFFKIK